MKNFEIAFVTFEKYTFFSVKLKNYALIKEWK